MVTAGLSISAALRVLEEQTTDQRLRDTLRDVRLGTEQGSSLSDALAGHPEAFPTFYVNDVRVGEVSGTLDNALKFLADALERRRF